MEAIIPSTTIYKPTHTEKIVKLLPGSRILCETLLQHNVDTIFGYPGGAIMPIYDALTYYPQLKHILMRHEQGASHAAEGYARITHKPGICFATSGPGATNLVTGLADALLDSTPLIAITGQVFSTLLGTDAFQEVDVVGITAPVTKYNFLVTKAEDIENSIHEAFRIATSGRPGPVLIDITKDAQVNKIEYKAKKNSFSIAQTSFVDLDKINDAIELIRTSKRPLILAGHGIHISESYNEFKEFVETTKIPVGTTLHGISSIPRQHPLCYGMLGMHGNYAPNMATGEADIIIALGMRFDDRVTGRLKDYAPHAKVIHVEVNNEEIGKNVTAHLGFNMDVKVWLQEINKNINTESIKGNRTEWLKKLNSWQQQEICEVTSKEEANPHLTAPFVVQCISKATNGNAIIVADVGQHQMFAARYYQSSIPNSFITSGGAGTMGFSLPAAIGAKKANPEREVWVIVGDGCFQMTMQEMQILSQEKLNIKIALINNNYLGMVRQWQELFFEHNYSQVNLHNPDFVALSLAFGVQAEKVTQNDQVEKAISRAQAYQGAYLIEFETQKEEAVFPMMPPGAATYEMRLK
ncbi:MAG: biosynthetic-type acetolactate synthase large subunit [bacterium]|nr:biosynthetic-type acetolactate synthase large subunit [bacterium]